MGFIADVAERPAPGLEGQRDFLWKGQVWEVRQVMGSG